MTQPNPAVDGADLVSFVLALGQSREIMKDAEARAEQAIAARDAAWTAFEAVLDQDPLNMRRLAELLAAATAADLLAVAARDAKWSARFAYLQLLGGDL